MERSRGRPPEGGRPLVTRWNGPGLKGPPAPHHSRARGGTLQAARGRRDSLLDGDRGAGALEGGPSLVGGVLGDLLQDRLRRAVDQVLRLLEAERGQAAHLLDHLDLLVAGALEDDVELVLLLGGGGTTVAGTTGGRGGRDGDRSSGGDLEGLLELLHEVGELEQRHLLERVEQLRGGQLGHDLSFWVSRCWPQRPRRQRCRWWCQQLRHPRPGRPPWSRRPRRASSPAARQPAGRPAKAGPGTDPRPC